MKIAMITGKDNHDSIFMPGESCAHPNLPENIKITEKNYGKLIEHYKNNPLIENKNDVISIEDIRRFSIAGANHPLPCRSPPDLYGRGSCKAAVRSVSSSAHPNRPEPMTVPYRTASRSSTQM